MALRFGKLLAPLLRSQSVSKRFHNIKYDKHLSYLNQFQATELDNELMSTPGFSVDQLMELAGYSVACSVAFEEKLPQHKGTKVLLVCGPGNNGGDGLVAARHLKHFGNYEPTIVYIKETKNQLYINLLQQCKDLEIPILNTCPDVSEFDIALDAMFGFSFKPPVREPFGEIIQKLNESGKPIVSVDIPSGWHVEKGPIKDGINIKPTMLISLTAPKYCAMYFHGPHWLGGRFIPPHIKHKYHIEIPEYESVFQCVKIHD